MANDEDDISPPTLRPPFHNSSSPRDKEPKEIEKLRKWQEERIARKLKGEYESAIVHLSELVTTFSSLTYVFLSYKFR